MVQLRCGDKVNYQGQVWEVTYVGYLMMMIKNDNGETQVVTKDQFTIDYIQNREKFS